MFTVCDKKKTEKSYVITPSGNGGFKKEFVDVPAEIKIYSVRTGKHGYPQFLIYEDKQWRWVSAKRFYVNE